jgi:hypothetical protein
LPQIPSSDDRHGGLRGTEDLLHRTGPEQSFRPLGRQAPGERPNDADGIYARFASAPLISGPGLNPAHLELLCRKVITLKVTKCSKSGEDDAARRVCYVRDWVVMSWEVTSAEVVFDPVSA